MKRVTLIQQNDTHAHVEPHWELRWRGGEPEAWRAGGFTHSRALAITLPRCAPRPRVPCEDGP